jgi:hypothetical protein
MIQDKRSLTNELGNNKGLIVELAELSLIGGYESCHRNPPL